MSSVLKRLLIEMGAVSARADGKTLAAVCQTRVATPPIRRGNGVSADRIEQMPRRMRDLLDGCVERFLVLLRGHSIAADLAHELERRGVHFVVGWVTGRDGGG